MNVEQLKEFINDPGERIGKYEIVREVGRGGMGVVYEAFDPDLKRTVALKVLKQADADRLRREAAAAAGLRHPHIVTIHEVGPHYIAMEFLRGRTLAALPRSRWPAALETVARAVAHAHAEGVVHRDLKPENVIVEEGGRVVLTDFGLAAEKSGGTPGFMPPEGVSGPAADVWALVKMTGVRGESAQEVADGLRRRRFAKRLVPAAILLAAVTAVLLWPRPDPLRDWSRREEELTRQLLGDPDNEALLLARSEVRQARGDFGRYGGRNPLPDYASAEEDLTRILLRRPESKAALHRRGVVRTQRAVYKVKYGIDPLGDCAAAEEDLTRALDHPGARTWRGNVRFHRGAWRQQTGADPRSDFEAAEADLTPAIDADTLMRRGRVLAHRGDFEGAERDFVESIRLNPRNVWAWTWRGNARLAARDFDGAEAHLTRAIETNPEFSEGWEQRGHARFENKDAAGAASDFRRALRLNPALEPLLSGKMGR
jgi:tetratricopeptide (TPR) repeat protein/predicted Ser/Thr protein kinase